MNAYNVGRPSKWGPCGTLRVLKGFMLLLMTLVISQLIMHSITANGSPSPLELENIPVYDPRQGSAPPTRTAASEQNIRIYDPRQGSAPWVQQDQQILVSFIVPCYEQLDTLKRTLDSITNQPGFPYFEIIIVNDGSPNEAEFDEFAKAYAAEKPAGIDHVHIWSAGPPVKPLVAQKRSAYFITKSNGGLSSARNFAIEMASGVWIMALDSDDMLAPTYFEATLREFMKHDLNMWEPGPYNVISPGVGLLDGKAYPDQPVGIEAVDLREGNGITYSSMYLRSIATKHGVKYRSALAWGWEDWDFWTQAHDKVGLKVLYVREPIFLYSSLGVYAKKDHMASFCEARGPFCKSIFVVANARLYEDKPLSGALDVLLNKRDAKNTILAGRAKTAQWNHLVALTKKPTPDPAALFLVALATISEDRQAALELLGQVMEMQCEANGVDRLAHMVIKRIFTVPEITLVFRSDPPTPATKCENVLFSRILLGDRRFSAARGWFKS